MLAMLFSCCTCSFEANDTDEIHEVAGCLYCTGCYQNDEIVMKCDDCGYKSGNYYDFKLVATSEYTDKNVCTHCAGDDCCNGRGCSNCYMTGY